MSEKPQARYVIELLSSKTVNKLIDDAFKTLKVDFFGRTGKAPKQWEEPKAELIGAVKSRIAMRELNDYDIKFLMSMEMDPSLFEKL